MDTDAATERARLDSHIADLEFAVAGFKRLLDRLASGGASDDIELRSLWKAAVVSYGRCFSGGRRVSLDGAVVPEPFRVAHQALLDDRDLVEAHAISTEERLVVGVLLGPDGELPVPGPPDLVVLHMGPLRGSEQVIRAYLSVAAQVQRQVEMLAKDVGLRVANEVTQLSDEERRAMPILELEPPTGDHGVSPDRRRKKRRA